MQQLILNIGTGETQVVETPVPSLRAGQVLINTTCSLISAGTERMLVEFGRASMIDKARQQPDKVRMVLDKMRTDGIMTTIEATRSKLDQPLALGYCNVGTVLQVGSGVTELKVGDRVVSNGSHAGAVSVPKNLCARVPDNVDNEAAVFTVIAAIALQGLRLVQPTIGETVVVVGLGVIGLLTVQMLRAQGCRVIGIDLDPERIEMARTFGANVIDPKVDPDVVQQAIAFSRGRGVDAVIITASTDSSEPLSQAAKMCRKRGRIVLVGVAGLTLSRQDFYEKELTFQVSCSYGPGRYDENYEQKGQDYPIGFVRWTEQRNFEAVLDLMSSGSLKIDPLITHRFSIERADDAYGVLTSGERSLGIVLQYPQEDRMSRSEAQTVILDRTKCFKPSSPIVGCIGAGNYGGRMLLPALSKSNAQLHTLVTANGLNGVHYGKKFGFGWTSTSTDELFSRQEINTVVIATRHDSHARLTVDALRHKCNVFVEKPLALTYQQLSEIQAAYSELASQGTPRILMVGFNRRFSPHVLRMKSMIEKQQGPKSLTFLVNAGAIPANHWTQDAMVGGGRVLGEACHFIDLARFLIGKDISQASAEAMHDHAGTSDTAQITLKFEDGSIASLQYFANGHRSFPKERIEVFASGRILQLDNFRVLRGFGYSGFRTYRTWKQDKGHLACMQAFLSKIGSGGPSPIPVEEIFEVSRVAIKVAEELGGH
jgi:predicted dehydrogenase